jgi:hypothetical protein
MTQPYYRAEKCKGCGGTILVPRSDPNRGAVTCVEEADTWDVGTPLGVCLVAIALFAVAVIWWMR